MNVLFIVLVILSFMAVLGWLFRKLQHIDKGQSKER
jgi:uncharacterized membrane protein AbrB (regulator of aidB expression)